MNDISAIEFKQKDTTDWSWLPNAPVDILKRIKAIARQIAESGALSAADKQLIAELCTLEIRTSLTDEVLQQVVREGDGKTAVAIISKLNGLTNSKRLLLKDLCATRGSVAGKETAHQRKMRGSGESGKWKGIL